jgi:hypothetical protein
MTPDCRLCNAAVPTTLGWLFAAELTDLEWSGMCDAHRDALAEWHRKQR